MQPFRHHVVLCTQQKAENVPCCAAGGATSTLAALNESLAKHGLAEQVLVSSTGCLGGCEHGPVMIVYPAGTWYGCVTAADVAEIVVEHLKNGRVVERLALSDEAALRGEILDHRAKFRAMMAAKDKAGLLPENSPIFELMRGFMPTRALFTALELDLFTAVGEGGTAAEIAARVNTNARATEMLLNVLAGLGLLLKTGERFTNAPQPARFLNAASPDNVRPGLMHQVHLWDSWSTLTACVRQGTQVEVAAGERTPETTRAFIAAMDRTARERATQVVAAAGGPFTRMLDLGGGSAAYSIAFARAHAELRGEILDQPSVVPLTREYISAAGLQQRITARAGDMLRDDFGTGFDLVVLSAIAHMFSEAENRALLARIYAALAPGGRLVLQDFLLDEDKTGPLFAALFSLNMLVNTAGGASYSESEYANWLRDAGFKTSRRVRLPGPANLMIAEK